MCFSAGNVSKPVSDSIELEYDGYKFSIHELISMFKSGLPKYDTQSATTGCRVFDQSSQQWKLDLCKVSIEVYSTAHTK